MKPKISVVIPSYNSARTLRGTLESLKKQSFRNFEVIVVDDSSEDGCYEIAGGYTNNYIRVLRNKKNQGPAASRNKGIKSAVGEIIALTDADCVPEKNWLRNIYKKFDDKNVNVIMGKVKIPKSTLLGDSISALGHPAGGSLGFDKMWHVSKEGWTERASSCNMGLRKKIFEDYGLFNESFPFAGGEDAELPYRLVRSGVKIKYCQDVVVWHVPRKSLSSFIKWQLMRGRSNYYCKQKLKGMHREFILLKAWSSMNILKKHYKDPKIFLIGPLLISSFVLQFVGYVYETMRET